MPDFRGCTQFNNEDEPSVLSTSTEANDRSVKFND